MVKREVVLGRNKDEPTTTIRFPVSYRWISMGPDRRAPQLVGSGLRPSGEFVVWAGALRERGEIASERHIEAPN